MKIFLMLLVSVIVMVGVGYWFFKPKGVLFERPVYDNFLKPDSFETYQDQVMTFLRQNRPDTPVSIIEKIAPFEIKPMQIKGAILLTHGLADTAFYFRETAQALAKKGFWIRTLLMGGHGSKPVDIHSVKEGEWNTLVEKQFDIFAKDYNGFIFIGGFSTGVNTVMSLALKNSRVAGMLLVAPAFDVKSKIAYLAPYVQYIISWISNKKENDWARYENMSVPSIAQYVYTAKLVQKDLKKISAYKKPVVMVVSSYDKIIDVPFAIDIFKCKFTHPFSKLIHYGHEPLRLQKEHFFQGQIPSLRYFSFGHLTPLFSAKNEHYGKNGDYNSMRFKGKDISTLNFGDIINDDKKQLCALYNPYFDEMIELIDQGLMPQGK